MRMEIRFHHMDRSEAVETYVQSKVTEVIDEVLHRHDGHVQVWLIAETNRASKGTPHFICEVEVRFPPRKDLFVSRGAPDMYAAINEVAETLRELLREEGKREVKQMRNGG